MRLATILLDGRLTAAVVRDGRALPAGDAGPGLDTVRAIAGGGPAALQRIRAWLDAQPADAGQPLDAVTFGPVVPDPGAIYTVGHNYRAPDEPAGPAPERPLIYGKAPTGVAGHGAVLTWDRALTANVDPEVELGIVIGAVATNVASEDAMGHVFGYTIINDVSSRDPWLDGDQWLLGKSMPGFCPVGPVVVTCDEVELAVLADLRLGCTIGGEPIQAGRTSQMRTSIPGIVAFLSRHLTLRPGDLIATGTPPRLATPPGSERHLQPGDTVTVSIEHIGDLTTTIA